MANVHIDMLRVHLDLYNRISQVYRAVNRLQLPYLRRLHVHVAETPRLHALRPQHPPEMLPGAREDIVQVPDLQQELPEHGVTVPQSRRGNSEPAHAARVPGYEGNSAVQRLLREEYG